MNTFHKLQPIPARCLNISLDEFQKTYYYVSVEYVTGRYHFHCSVYHVYHGQISFKKVSLFETEIIYQ